jgi:hypothetical protein
MRSSRVGFVSVHYYDAYLPRAIAAAAQLARRVGAQALLLVTNRADLLPQLQARAKSLDGGAEVLLHDNSGVEFGAYEAGLRHLQARLELDWVAFVNDTFSIHSCFSSVFRERFAAAVQRPSDGSALEVTGEVVSMPRSYCLEGLRTHRWITTNAFAINAGALGALGHQLYFPGVDELICGGSDLERFFSPRLDPAMVTHLVSWLLVERGPQTWYGAEPLGPQNAERLARKARAILQEKYLAARLDEAGAWFLDINASGVRERIMKRLEIGWFEATRRLQSPLPAAR